MSGVVYEWNAKPIMLSLFSRVLQLMTLTDSKLSQV